VLSSQQSRSGAVAFRTERYNQMLPISSAMTAVLCDVWQVNATNNGSTGRIYHCGHFALNTSPEDESDDAWKYRKDGFSIELEGVARDASAAGGTCLLLVDPAETVAYGLDRAQP
jgi:hypothetical protein